MRFYEGPSKDGLYSLPTLVFASPVTLFVPLSFDISQPYMYTYTHCVQYTYVCIYVYGIGRNAGIIASRDIIKPLMTTVRPSWFSLVVIIK